MLQARNCLCELVFAAQMSKDLETKVPEFSSACYGVAASETHDHWAWTCNGVPGGRALPALIQLR
jgi:hypothetical protein